MGRVLLVMLAACGSAPPPAPPLKNVAPAAAHAPTTSPCGIGDFRRRESGTFYGAVCDPQVREWLVGVTVVATGPNLMTSLVALSNEKGVFAIAVPPGDYTVTYYYSDCTWVRRNHVEGADTPPAYVQLIQKGCK